MKTIYYMGFVYKITEEKYLEMRAWHDAFFKGRTVDSSESKGKEYHDYMKKQFAEETLICEVDNWF